MTPDTVTLRTVTVYRQSPGSGRPELFTRLAQLRHRGTNVRMLRRRRRIRQSRRTRYTQNHERQPRPETQHLSFHFPSLSGMSERVSRILPRERNTPNVITPKAPSTLRRSQIRMLERRVEPRLMCADMVAVRWKNESGVEQQASALLEDISASGACLNLDSPLPLGAGVVINYRKGRFEGSVCYCFFREIGYYVGVQLPARIQMVDPGISPQAPARSEAVADASDGRNAQVGSVTGQPARPFRHLCRIWQKCLFERRTVRNRRVRSRHPHDRPVQILKRLLGDPPG